MIMSNFGFGCDNKVFLILSKLCLISPQRQQSYHAKKLSIQRLCPDNILIFNSKVFQFSCVNNIEIMSFILRTKRQLI